MQWSDIPFDPPRKTLRQFGGLCILVFGGLACWEGFQHGSTGLAIGLAVLALTIGPLGLVRPQLIRPIFIVWMIVAFPIGWTVSRLLLALMFYGLFTPVALVFKLIGRDVLFRRYEPNLTTYWDPKPTPREMRSYLRQF